MISASELPMEPGAIFFGMLLGKERLCNCPDTNFESHTVLNNHGQNDVRVTNIDDRKQNI